MPMCSGIRNTVHLWESVCGSDRKVCERSSKRTCRFTKVVASRPLCHTCQGLPVLRLVQENKNPETFRGTTNSRALRGTGYSVHWGCLRKRAVRGLVTKRTLFFKSRYLTILSTCEYFKRKLPLSFIYQSFYARRPGTLSFPKSQLSVQLKP